MKDLISGEKGMSGCCSGDSGNSCCPPSDGNVSPCCNPGDSPWSKTKLLISVIIIVAAIIVGANSFLSVNQATSYTALPVKSFSSTLMKIPTAKIEDTAKDKSQASLREVSLSQALDSLQALDTLAVDKEVVFLVLPGEALIHAVEIPIQVRTVVNNLWQAGKKVGVFTLKSSSPDYAQLSGRFAVKSFPCVIVMGRQGTASAVSGDVTEARLYNAFVLASTAVPCCPTAQSNPSCCPK